MLAPLANLSPFRGPRFVAAGGGAFDPAAYGAPLLYEDADDVTGSVGGNVSTWPFNAYGADAVYTGGTNPTKQSGPNGHFAVQFSGGAFLDGNLTYSGTSLAVVSVLKMFGSTPSYGRAISLGVVDQFDFNQPAYASAIIRNGLNDELISYRESPLSSVSITPDTWYVVVAEWDGTNHTIYLNGSPGIPVSSAGTFNFQQFRLGEYLGGAGAYWEGQEACNILYSSLTDRSGLVATLRTKFGI